jgi:hypothetical protein
MVDVIGQVAAEIRPSKPRFPGSTLAELIRIGSAFFSDTCLLFLESDRPLALRLFLVDCAVDRQVEPLHW